MTGAALVLVGLSWAGDTLTPSPPGTPAPGECPQSFPVRGGEPIVGDLAPGGCVAACSGVLVPTSQVVDLIEADIREQLHVADIELLKLQRRDLQEQLEEQGSPWVHRAQGAGVIGIVTLAVIGGWYAVDVVAGGRR